MLTPCMKNMTPGQLSLHTLRHKSLHATGNSELKLYSDSVLPI